ncbi:MAG: hypothetical protein MUF34_32455 [Polyangiaceae bacterium]|nr:hypothetical protein [Polyangiaceae bacterium]
MPFCVLPEGRCRWRARRPGLESVESRSCRELGDVHLWPRRDGRPAPAGPGART